MFGIFERTKAYTDLSSAEFAKKIKEDKNAVIIDVRTPGEFNSGKIPGAINMDIMRPDFASKIETLDKDKTYYVYCRSGSRSAQACQMISAKGLQSFNLARGVIGWSGMLL